MEIKFLKVWKLKISGGKILWKQYSFRKIKMIALPDIYEEESWFSLLFLERKQDLQEHSRTAARKLNLTLGIEGAGGIADLTGKIRR